MDAVLLIVPLVIALAFFGEAIFGFGGGLLAIPLLGVVLGVKDAVTLVLLFQLCMGLLIWQSYRQIDWRVARPMAASLIIGTVAGTLLLSQANVLFLQLSLAIFILLFLAKTVWFNGYTLGTRRSGGGAVAAGLGGGLFQGLIGIGGPVLTMYLSVALQSKIAMRATLIFLFFITSVVRMEISASEGLFTTDILQLALLALPGFLLAIFVGQKLHQKVSERYYRLGIHTVLAGSAVVLLCKVVTS